MRRLLDAFSLDDREQVRALWTEFECGLEAHMEAEERHLMPLLATLSERETRILLEEHARIRAQLAELGVGVDLHLVRLEAAQAFIDHLRQHAAHEDTLLYKRADETLDDGTRRGVFSALASALSRGLSRKARQP